VRSVVWFSDVRGFTSLSCRLEREHVIGLINDVFEVTETVLKKHGGQILKFMGDGVLAVFTEPDGEDHEGSTSDRCMRDSLTLGTPVCGKAKAAAAEFQKKLKEMSDKRVAHESPGAEVGIGLHYGDCSYGNVGAESRLDFTVIGPSVNLASRVEGLCSKLGASVLATEEFVQRDLGRRSGWTFRGKHSLKGVMGETPIYELMMAT
jgi:adenylate cyclase